MYVEKKRKVNAEKVSFVKAFPGLLKSWEESKGKAIKEILKTKDGERRIIIFEDLTFIFTPPLELQPAFMIRLLLLAKPILKAAHNTAYQQLDQFIKEDKELQRMARLENIMGALENNLPQIPELKEELRLFLDKKSSG